MPKVELGRRLLPRCAALNPPVPLAKLLPVSKDLTGRLALAGGGLVLGQMLLGDLLHVPGGGFGVLLAGAGVWWLSRGTKAPSFQEPSSLQGWIARCKDVLDQFETLESDGGVRRHQLDLVVERSGPQRLALVCVDPASCPEQGTLEQALAGGAPLTLSMARPLNGADGTRTWPKALHEQDLILFSLAAPLLAEDLLWIQQLPEDQPSWLLVQSRAGESDRHCCDSLLAQLPPRWVDRVLVQQPDGVLRDVLQPLRRQLGAPIRNLQHTRQRLLRDLHQHWQADLEQVRRRRFQALQQRTQWIVAASVMASPLPSLDLLAVAVANGLMLREMGCLWGTDLQPDLLREAAGQLARAALAQGVVEWSSQMLLGLAKLDGGSWLIAGSMQAISAAYLTRVVGRSMADWLALNAGVRELDLERLKREAPVLVANAAEQERLDWGGFMKQSQQWLLQASS